MIKENTLFNYKETQQLNALEKMVGELSHDVAIIKNELNNLKSDIKKDKMIRMNQS